MKNYLQENFFPVTVGTMLFLSVLYHSRFKIFKDLFSTIESQDYVIQILLLLSVIVLANTIVLKYKKFIK